MKNFLSSILVLLALVSTMSIGVKAHTSFQSGEILQYNLYYNWSFVWVKAGTATMSITNSSYNGTPAYKTRLLMRGSKQADSYFVLRDTLTSFVRSDNLKPLYYCKNDIEGKRRHKRSVWYTYSGNTVRARQQYKRADGTVTNKDEQRTTAIHDMLSIMLNARNYNTSSWQKGKRINFNMTDGNGVSTQALIYRGKTNVKMKDSSDTYRCLQLSFVETRDGKSKEVVTFFVTDDANHIPVRLDLFLRFGSAKAYLTSSRGLKNAVGAKVK